MSNDTCKYCNEPGPTHIACHRHAKAAADKAEMEATLQAGGDIAGVFPIDLTGVGIVEITCLHCGATAETLEAQTGEGRDCFGVSDLPRGWYVFDQYPPGDLGLGWACSAACLEALCRDPQ